MSDHESETPIASDPVRRFALIIKMMFYNQVVDNRAWKVLLEMVDPVGHLVYARAFARGEARGGARSILAVLDRRGVPVPDLARRHVLACTDLTRLHAWFGRAVTATTMADVFDGFDWLTAAGRADGQPPGPNARLGDELVRTVNRAAEVRTANDQVMGIGSDHRLTLRILEIGQVYAPLAAAVVGEYEHTHLSRTPTFDDLRTELRDAALAALTALAVLDQGRPAAEPRWPAEFAAHVADRTSRLGDPITERPGAGIEPL
jgi:hypothetical protein